MSDQILDLATLKELVEDLRRAGVKRFKHPCGLEIDIDTKASPNVIAAPVAEPGEF